MAGVGPKTIDELIAVVPGVRRMRAMNADLLRLLLARGRRECTWCGQPVGPGRSTWCSDVCVATFKSRCCQQTFRRLVEKRDQGMCQSCGRNTIEAEQQARRDGLREYVSRSGNEDDAAWTQRQKAREAELLARGYARGRWREVDHILPVVEGGGLCGPDGLRLVCGACHAEHTKKLSGRMASPRATR